MRDRPERMRVGGDPVGLGRQLEVQKNFLGITDEDIEAVRAIAPLVGGEIEGIVDGFYDHLLRFPDLRDILDLSTVQRLKGIIAQYLRSVLQANIDQEYFLRRLEIGRAHVRVGLRPHWFLGAYGYFLDSLTRAICAQAGKDEPGTIRAMTALQKIMMLDVNIALATYYEIIHREELQRTEERHRAIVENATDVIWSFTPDGRITYMNRGVCGYSRDVFLDKGISVLDGLYRSESRETFERAIGRLRDSRAGVQNVPTSLRNPATRQVEHYLSNLSPVFGEHGDLVAIQAITRDVTGLKKLEQEVIDRERLATVGRMAANVAHEIRNPLAGIKGALEALRPRFGGTESEEAVLQEILERIDALNATVQDLLIFSRPLVLEKLEISLRPFLETVVSILRDDPAFSDVTVENVVPEDLKIPLDGKQGRIAFTNLILNSVQAMEGHGRIRMVAVLRGDTAEIFIEDDGPGVEESVRGDLFKPFFTTKSTGTGLGLAIVSWIVKGHGGTIGLDESYTGGARFRITLPLE